MPAPVAVVAAMAAARTASSPAGRKALRVVLVLLVVFGFLSTGLVLAMPMAVAAQISAPAEPEPSPEAPLASGEWGYPLAGGYYKGRGFGWNPVPGCAYCSTDHKGYDMSQGCGSTIYAAGAGTVDIAGAWQGYGNTVRIDHGDEIVTLYGHMLWGSLRVSPGQKVVAGTPLGAEGNTGNSFGCHLHFEVQIRAVPVDPEPFMADRGIPLT